MRTPRVRRGRRHPFPLKLGKQTVRTQKIRAPKQAPERQRGCTQARMRPCQPPYNPTGKVPAHSRGTQTTQQKTIDSKKKSKVQSTWHTTTRANAAAILKATMLREAGCVSAYDFAALGGPLLCRVWEQSPCYDAKSRQVAAFGVQNLDLLVQFLRRGTRINRTILLMFV